MKDPFHQALEISRQSGPHVEEVRRLLVFHGLGYGEPDSLALIEAKLADSNAFRTDLSALARHISALEHRTVTDDEMQRLIQWAAGAKQEVEEPSGSSIAAHDPNPGSLLAGTGAIHPQVSPARAAPDPAPPPAPGTAPEPSTPAAEAETGGSQKRLELAVTELKLYLDDINRRIGRIEPHLEDISRIVRNSADRLPSPRDAAEPAGADRQSPPEAPKPPATPPLRQIEPDLKHRGSPSPVVVDSPPAGEPSAAARLLSRHTPRSAEHITFAGIAQPGTQERTATTIANGGSHRNVRETAGKLLAVVAVLLAIVGGIAAMYAFDKQGENATAAKAGAQTNQGAPLTADRGRSAPDTSQPIAQPAVVQSAPPPVRPQDTLGRDREPQSSATLLKAPLPPPPPNLAPRPGVSSAPVAKVAGKRSEPPRREPRIEVLPAAQPPPRGETHTERSRTQDVASRTDSAVGGKLVANGPPPSVVSYGVGTPEVESHSSQGALISSKKPVYPPEALSQHKEGTVVLDALIAKDGSVKRMDVVEGSPGFTRSALNAVSWWRYKPKARGEAAETQARITVNYRIR